MAEEQIEIAKQMPLFSEGMPEDNLQVESFGDDVAFLVDGVTKVDNIIFKSEEHKQAENFTKLFLSLAKDLRVIIIKFADRLNNMQTIEYLSPKKRKEIAEPH